MEWGSIADWFSAIGGVLACIAAFTSWLTSRRALQLERQRNEEERVRQKKSQAQNICALGAKLTERGHDQCWSIYLRNGSGQPITRIRVESQNIGNGSSNYPLELEALPPGEFVIPSSAQYHWGTLIDLAKSPEPMQFLVKGKGGKMITSLTFTDHLGQTWRQQDHQLEMLTES